MEVVHDNKLAVPVWIRELWNPKHFGSFGTALADVLHTLSLFWQVVVKRCFVLANYVLEYAKLLTLYMYTTSLYRIYSTVRIQEDRTIS